MARWSRRYDRRLLEELVNAPPMESRRFAEAEWLEGWARDLQARLNADSGISCSYQLAVRRDKVLKVELTRKDATELVYKYRLK